MVGQTLHESERGLLRRTEALERRARVLHQVVEPDHNLALASSMVRIFGRLSVDESISHLVREVLEFSLVHGQLNVVCGARNRRTKEISQIVRHEVLVIGRQELEMDILEELLASLSVPAWWWDARGIHRDQVSE